MLARLKEFPEILDKYFFKCTLCANCCTGDQKVHLDLYDLYKMAQIQNFDHTGKLFSASLVNLISTERGVYLPRIRFKHKPFRFCPFLINDIQSGYCQLHPKSKPLVCSLAPVGREVDFEQNSDRYFFVKPAVDCPGVARKAENSLNELQQCFKQELSWQKSFFLILQNLQESDWSRTQFTEKLYTFPTQIPFVEILTDLERKYGTPG